MLVLIEMHVEAPDDARPSAVMAAAMDAVDKATPYTARRGELLEIQDSTERTHHG